MYIREGGCGTSVFLILWSFDFSLKLVTAMFSRAGEERRKEEFKSPLC
jgi:hypothetical protein